MHHVGYVTSSIADSVEEYVTALGLKWDGRITHDPLQMVSVTFLTSRDDDSAAQVELVEPSATRSPVSRFLEKGGGLHHVCFEVADLAEHVEEAEVKGSMLVRVPMPAVAFDGRKIAWIVTPGGQLIEFLEATSDSR
jgi:methylmalonyl-CoA/ethylmalonyl-CoA epimerase